MNNILKSRLAKVTLKYVESNPDIMNNNIETQFPGPLALCYIRVPLYMCECPNELTRSVNHSLHLFSKYNWLTKCLCMSINGISWFGESNNSLQSLEARTSYLWCSCTWNRFNLTTFVITFLKKFTGSVVLTTICCKNNISNKYMICLVSEVW